MPEKLKSRKFWFALLGALLPVIAQYFSSEVDLNAAIQLSAGVVVAYLFGQGYVDGKALEGVPPKE
tara:strand:+ start:1119 stop:1316 length:198 start_codon:yes stop_codon:yes gene_type:complete